MKGNDVILEPLTIFLFLEDKLEQLLFLWILWRPTKNCQNQAKTPETPKESSVNIYNVVMIWTLESPRRGLGFKVNGRVERAMSKSQKGDEFFHILELVSNARTWLILSGSQFHWKDFLVNSTYVIVWVLYSSGLIKRSKVWMIVLDVGKVVIR